MKSERPVNPRPKSLQIMIVAGEASGEKHGAALAKALKDLFPETTFKFFGSGGDEMRAAGVELLVDVREIATIGIAEVVAKLPRFYRAFRSLLSASRLRRPDAVVLIDWPDFNMRLAKRLHRERFKIVYYIGPQVWAWRRHRVNALKRDVDRMLVILPFEREFFQRAGIPVEYVGHPLYQAVKRTASKEEFCNKVGLDPRSPLISLLPGSRHSEVRHHLPLMLDAAARLRRSGLPIARGGEAPAGVMASAPGDQSTIRNPQFVIPLASTIDRQVVEPDVKRRLHSCDGLNLVIAERDTYNALFNSELAVIASGTATVEAALAGTPMVIIYRASALNWRVLRPLINLDTFGMVNLIAGSKIVPELIQNDATADNIAEEVSAILSDAGRVNRMRRGLETVKTRLWTAGQSGPERAAAAVMRAIAES